MEEEIHMVKWFRRPHLPEALEIERKSYDPSWTQENFIEYLSKSNCTGKVIEKDNKIRRHIINQ